MTTEKTITKRLRMKPTEERVAILEQTVEKLQKVVKELEQEHILIMSALAKLTNEKADTLEGIEKKPSSN